MLKRIRSFSLIYTTFDLYFFLTWLLIWHKIICHEDLFAIILQFTEYSSKFNDTMLLSWIFWSSLLDSWTFGPNALSNSSSKYPDQTAPETLSLCLHLLVTLLFTTFFKFYDDYNGFGYPIFSKFYNMHWRIRCNCQMQFRLTNTFVWCDLSLPLQQNASYTDLF